MILKFLLIVFAVLYLIGFLFRWVLGKFVRNVREGYYGSTQQSYQGNTQRVKNEGEVSIDYKPPKKKPKDFKGGEYVDYEELK